MCVNQLLQRLLIELLLPEQVLSCVRLLSICALSLIATSDRGRHVECEAREQLLSSGSSRDAAQRWERRALELRRHCGHVRAAPSSSCRRRLAACSSRRRTLPLAVQRAAAADAQVVHSALCEEFALQLAAGALQMRTSYSQREREQTKQGTPSHLFDLLEVSNSHCVQWLAVGAEAHKSRESQVVPRGKSRVS